MIIEKDGLGGLFGRGLRTKILSNAVQGIMFSVLWRMGQVRRWGKRVRSEWCGAMGVERHSAAGARVRWGAGHDACCDARAGAG